jgi:hypothetical protein
MGRRRAERIAASRWGPGDGYLDTEREVYRRVDSTRRFGRRIAPDPTYHDMAAQMLARWYAAYPDMAAIRAAVFGADYLGADFGRPSGVVWYDEPADARVFEEDVTGSRRS